MKKFIAGVALAVSCALAFPCVSEAKTIKTSAAHSINNENDSIDYKVSDTTLEHIQELLTLSYMADIPGDETDRYYVSEPTRVIYSSGSSGSSTSGNKASSDAVTTAKAWLIENNYLERKATISVNASNPLPTITLAEDLDDEWDSYVATFKVYKSYAPSTASKAKSYFSAFVSESLSEAKSLKSSNCISSTKLTKINTKLSTFESDFKEAVADETSGDGVQTLYTTYLKKAKKYMSKFIVTLRVGNTSEVKKSDFLMLLDKVAFGVQESRAVVWHGNSWRKFSGGRTNQYTTQDYWLGTNYGGANGSSILAGYWDSDELYGDASFQGDYYYYVSSNVYELYLVDLLNRGIVFEDEFSDNSEATDLLEAYDDGSLQNESWYQGAGLASWGSNVLGAGYNYVSSGANKSYVPQKVSYFENESLTVMDVYQYVEDILRQTEGDMTESEADIVSYKFGQKFLAQYSGEELTTLKYLIAKGILNFEDEDEFLSLDEEATNETVYLLLYRLANEGARFDFSEITLTDTDSYWQEKGYEESESTISTTETSSVMSSSVEEVSTNTASVWNFLGSILGTVNASSKTEYEVTYLLASKGVTWKYGKYTIKSDMDTDAAGIYKLTSVKKKVNGKSTTMWKLVVRVKATTSAKALSSVKSMLSVSSGSSNTVDTVTKVSTTSGKGTYSLISQTILQQTFSTISVVEDKVLLNTQTNTQAIILQDLGYALVGNQIIRTNTLMVTNVGSGDEVYYNLNIIIALLDNAMLKKVGGVKSIFYTPDCLTETYANVDSEYGDSGVDVRCGTFQVTKNLIETMSTEGEEYSAGDKLFYYRVDDLTDGVNTVWRSFSVTSGGVTEDMIVIVDFVIAIPEQGIYADSSVQEVLSGGSSGDTNLTTDELTTYLYTRPTENMILQAWWDSNYVISNALCNFMYGTESTEYLTTGYAVPEVTILCGNSSNIKTNIDKYETELFSSLQGYAYSATDTEDSSATDHTADASTLAKYFNGGGDNWASWYSIYTDPEAMYSWLVSSGDISESDLAELKALADSYHTFDVFYGQSAQGKSIRVFGDSYIRAQNGVLYRNLDSDSRIYSHQEEFSGTTVTVKDVLVKTRQENYTTAEKNSTVIQTETGKQLLFTGTATIDGNTYYKLSPISDTAVKKLSKSLYNGGYVSYSTEKSDDDKYGVTFVVDKNTSSNNQARSNYSNEENYTTWEKLYAKWRKKYFSDSERTGVLSRSKLTLATAFGYSAAANKKAGSNGLEDGDTYFQYSTSESGSLAANLGSSVDTSVIYRHRAELSVHSLNRTTVTSAFLFSVSDGVYNFTKLSTYKKIKSSFNNNVLAAGSSAAISPGDLFNSYADWGTYQTQWIQLLKDGKYTDNLGTTNVSVNTFRVMSVADNTESFMNLRQNAAIETKSGSKYANSDYMTYAIPVFYLDVSNYAFTGDGTSTSPATIVQSSGAAAVCYGNFYYNGVTESVQNAIIANYVGTTDLNCLGKGAQVTIGSVRFYVAESGTGSENSVWLYSARINVAQNSKNAKKLVKAANNYNYDEESFRSAVVEMFNGVMIECDGAFYNFSSYIMGKNKTGTKSGIQIYEGLNKTKSNSKKGIVYQKGSTNKAWGYKNGTTKKLTKKATKGTTYKYVRIKIKVNGYLKVRPLDSDGAYYTLTQTTKSGNLGYGSSSLIFYNESLSYSDNQYDSLAVSSSRFSPSAVFATVKAQFLKEWNEAFAEGLKGYFLVLVIIICGYVMIMNWMVFLTLRTGLMVAALEAIAAGQPGGSRRGVDLIKVFSLGMYSLDSEPRVSRMVFISAAAVAIIAYALVLL